MSDPTYKVGVIARLFGLSERRVQQLAKDGTIPKPEKGKYELVGCVRGYIKFLQDRAFGKEMAPIDVHYERGRLLKAQADKTELEAKAMRRELLPAVEVETGWAALAMAFRSRLQGLPTRAAHRVMGLTNFQEIESALRELVHEALNELSRYDPAANSRSDTQNREAGGTAAVTDHQPVGGSVSPAE